MTEQPSIDIRREMDLLANSKPELVKIPSTDRRVLVGWLHNETIRKISSVHLSKRKDTRYERQISSRVAALIVLNGYWKIKFFYHILWRWYYYVRQYHDYQLLPIVETGKKKVVPIPSWLIMTYLQGLDDTLAAMTRKEVEARSHQEQS